MNDGHPYGSGPLIYIRDPHVVVLNLCKPLDYRPLLYNDYGYASMRLQIGLPNGLVGHSSILGEPEWFEAQRTRSD